MSNPTHEGPLMALIRPRRTSAAPAPALCRPRDSRTDPHSRSQRTRHRRSLTWNLGALILLAWAATSSLQAATTSIRAQDITEVAGREVIIPLKVAAIGQENALSFSLNFDSALLTFVNDTPGSAAGGLSILRNTNQAAAGQIGYALALPYGKAFPSGTNEVLKLRFRLGLTTTTTTLDFGDTPIARETVDNAAAVLASTYTAATITIAPLVSAGISTQPQSVTLQPIITIPTNITLSVTASGSPPFFYQWRRESSALAGETNTSLRLVNVDPSFTGNYDVIVSNAGGSITSQVAVVTVQTPLVPPAISAPPISWIAAAGEDVAFSVSATGSEPLAYQWLYNNQKIANATQRTLVLPAVTTARNGNYSCQVTNTAGTVTSSAASLSVSATPRFLRAQDRDIATDSEVLVPIQFAALGDENAVGFSLSFDPTRLLFLRTEGAVGNLLLNTNSLAAGNVGFALVRNTGERFAAGTSTLLQLRFRSRGVSGTTPLTFGSQPVALDVADIWGNSRPFNTTNGVVNVLSTPPAITDHPRSATNQIYSTAQFSVAANGSQPLSYQWQLNGVSIPGAQNDTLTLPNVRPSQAGSYRVIVSNPVAAVTSTVATLTVPRLIAAGSTNGATGNRVEVPLYLLAHGDENAAGFSLRFDPARLAFLEASAGTGLGSAALHINSNHLAAGQIGFAMAHNYGSVFAAGTQQLAVVRFTIGAQAGEAPLTFADQPVVSELVDGTTSPLLVNFQSGKINATLESPIVTSQPQAADVLQGTGASFSVTARGSLPMTFQWQRNGLDLPGQTSTTLTIPNVLLADAGAYSVRIRNDAGTTNSTPAILSVRPPPSDLFVTRFDAPVELVAGQPLTLWWSITNSGTQTATSPWQDQVLVADNPRGDGARLLGQFTFYTALAPSQWLNHTGIVIVPPDLAGTKYLGVVVDSGFQVPESNEANNALFSPTSTEVRTADLLAGPIASVASAQFGQTIAVNWAVTNLGNATANSPWTDRLYLSTDSTSVAGATVLASVAGPSALAPGQGYQRAISAVLPNNPSFAAGTYYLIAVADYDHAQPESSEANNAAAVAITLTPPPRADLAVQQVLAPAQVTPGQPFELKWAISNLGAVPASGRWTDAVHWSNSVSGLQELARFDFNDSLPAGGSTWRTQTVTIPIQGPAGTLWLGVQTDRLNEIAEGNEVNNLTLSATETTLPLTLTLQSSLAQISEDATTPSFNVVLYRNGPATSALTANLTSSDLQGLTVPATITIPAGQTSASFAARVVRDGVVSGARQVTIQAAAVGFAAAQVPVVVLNADLPRLAFTVVQNTVPEGMSLVLTITRDLVTPQAVTVTLQSSNPSQLSPPSFVTIPANAASATFTALAVDDNLVEPPLEYSIQATAAGFAEAISNVLITDNDAPGVSVTLAQNTISEGAGPQAAVATITRSFASTRSLLVELVSTNPAAALVPTRVHIPAGQTSTTFPVAAVNNDLVDGAKSTLIRAFVLDSTATLRLYEGEGAALTVTDDDGPTLKMTAAKKLVAEGLATATTLTVSRNTTPTGNVVVALTSSDTTEATVPATVTIPDGSPSVTVPVTSVADGQTDGNQSVTFTATAQDFVSATETIVVSDADLPDLIVQSVTAPPAAETDSYVSVTYRVVNQGLGPAGTNFVVRVYLAQDPFGTDKVLASQAPFEGTIPVGLFYDQALQIRLPMAAGDYYVVVEVDAALQIGEILEDNNLKIAATPIRSRAAYSATVQTSLTQALANTQVPMTGRAFNDAGVGLPSKLVNIHIFSRGTERVISALTDSLGNFSTTWQPLPGEAGYYQIFATHPGVNVVDVQDDFRLVGMRVSPTSTGLTVVEGSSRAGSIQVENLSDLPLTSLTATVVSAPAGLAVQATLASGATLAGGATTLLNFTVTPASASAYGPVSIHLESAEGAAADIHLGVSVEPLRPRLVATPTRLLTGMARGRQTTVEFQVVNEGGVPTGPITIALPQVPWLTTATPNPMPALDPGASNAVTVTLLLTPAADLPLGPYQGNIALNSSNAGLTVPFEFRALSEAKGDLLITAVDELTYYAEGSPNLAGAQITVRDAVTHTNVATGITDEHGKWFIGQLPEAYYEIELSADKHTSFRGNYLLLAGQTNELSAFLSRQVVTYAWTVEPIEIEDRYKITIETVFETVVPLPVVTITPSVIDLADITAAETQIMLSITNHGLIAANNTVLNFPSHPLWEFTPLLSKIGTLPARSGLTIPVIIRKLAPPGSAAGVGHGIKDGDLGPCSLSANTCWQLVCGGETNTYCATVAMPNARAGCGGGGGYGGGGWGGGYGGGGYGGGWSGGGTYVSTPSFTMPSLCDCSYLDGICLRGEQSFDLDGLAQKIVGMLGKLLPPPLQLDDVSVSISVGGELCTCCEDGHLGLAGNAHGSAEIEVVVLLGRGASLPDMEFSAPGWSNISISGSAMAGLRLTGTGTVSVEYTKECQGGQKLCGSGSLTLNLFGGLEIEGTASAKFLADQLTYTGTISGQLGLEGEVSVTLEGCSDSGFTITGCGEANARAHLTGELVTVTPTGSQTNTIGPNGDVELLRRTCIGGAPLPTSPPRFAGRHDTKDNDPIVEVVPGDQFIYPLPSLLGKMGISGVESGGICAHVKLKTEQEAVVTRDAFRATLEIGNQDANRLENIGVTIAVTDVDGVDCTHLFGIRPPELVGLSSTDGSGILAGASIGTAKWILVPGTDAAPTNATQYFVSGRFTYNQGGTTLVVPLAPVSITVLPMPKLYVDYFHDRDVFSDDPFTDPIEPSVPFNLAVMIRNKGYGTAKKFRITSAQPQIVENEKGLLIDFKIIATEVAGKNMVPSLTADFGDIGPTQSAVGRWLMTSTLQGLFVDYKATFEHVDAIGDVKLSLLEQVNIHEMIHLVQAGGRFEDGKPDFLVNEVPDLRDLPDTLWLSDGSTSSVQVVEHAMHDGAPTPSRRQVQLSASMPAGWTYLLVPDPADGKYRLTSVRRSDGVEVPLDKNVWVTDRTFVGLSRPPVRENMLHLLDYDSTGLYTLSYEPNAAGDSSSPNSSVTALPANSYRQFAVSWTGLDEPGGSGLAGYDIYVSKDGGPFSRWLERTGLSGSVYFGDQGSSYSFYSVAIDQAGNRESIPSAPDANTTVSLSNRAPAFAPIGTQDIDEGREFTLTPFASDPDAGDSLQFSLVSAPSGMTINPSTGQLRWLTSEGTGPRTTQVVLRVQDQGEPPLSATTEFTLIVREVNTPPTLAAIADRTINEGSLLEFTNVVSDLDLPANTFTFSLAPGAPAGATVNPVTGVFRWRPTETQGPSTNHITILVADNGQPSLSDARSFQVIVRDFLSDFSLSLGRTALLAGEAGSVPVTLRSGLDLTSLTLWLGSSDIHLSDLNLRGMGPEVLGASLVSTSENLSRLSFILDPALAPGNNRVVAALDFLAVDQPHSAIIPLAASGLQARRADGTLVTNGRAVSGQVIVVGAEPVLESTWENAPQITLYGRPGSTYDVETAARLQSPPQWHPWTSVTMTNISQVLTWPNPSDPQRFFRGVSP